MTKIIDVKDVDLDETVIYLGDGTRLTEAMAEEWGRDADERVRAGRPSLAAGESPRISARIPEGLKARIAERARVEGKKSAEIVREAWEAGAFDHRVELVEGEVWPVVIGDWHGETVGHLIRLLGQLGVRARTSTLPSGTSLPDPHCWIRRPGSEPAGTLGTKLSLWSPHDVLLVVEVSDETLLADLTTKARIYGAAGWPVYFRPTRWPNGRSGFSTSADVACSVTRGATVRPD